MWIEWWMSVRQQLYRLAMFPYYKVRKKYSREASMHMTLTSKGQITLPKSLRDKLGLCAGDKVEFYIEDEQSARLVVKHVPVTRLKGLLPKPAQPVSLEEMDRAILKKAGIK